MHIRAARGQGMDQAGAWADIRKDINLIGFWLIMFYVGFLDGCGLWAIAGHGIMTWFNHDTL